MKTSVTHEFVVVVCSSQRFLQVPCGFILGIGELTHLIIIGREIDDRLARFQNVTDFHHNRIWFNGAAQLMKKPTRIHVFVMISTCRLRTCGMEAPCARNDRVDTINISNICVELFMVRPRRRNSPIIHHVLLVSLQPSIQPRTP